MKNLQFAKLISYFSENHDDVVLNQLMYLVDKTHLEKYGRQVSDGLYYKATKSGPYSFYIDEQQLQRIELQMDEFSDSDLECAKLIVSEFYKNKPNWYLAQISKDQAWQRAYDQRDCEHADGEEYYPPKIKIEDIVEQFNNSKILKDYLKENGKRMG